MFPTWMDGMVILYTFPYMDVVSDTSVDVIVVMFSLFMVNTMTWRS